MQATASTVPAGNRESGSRVFLPKEMVRGTWRDLIKWGFKPTGVENESLQEVDLPPGWSLSPIIAGESRRMLTDSAKRERVVYYTDSSQLNILQRYDFLPKREPSQFPFRSMHYYAVLDAGKPIWKTDDVADPALEATHHAHEVFEERRKGLRQVAYNYLNEKYPGWEDDCTAYWD